MILDKIINSTNFRKYNVVDDKTYKIHKTKEKIVHNEPILFEFVVLKNAKHRMLEFCYNLLGIIMRPKILRAIEMDTESFCMALTENISRECFTDMDIEEMKKKLISTTDKKIAINQTPKRIFSPVRFVKGILHSIKEQPGFSKVNRLEPRSSVSTATHTVHLPNKIER